jgi:hypothetical protein
MTKIVISAETETHVTRHPDPDDEWDSGDTDGHVSNVIAYVETRNNHYYGSSECVELDVTVGGTVYAVVADYDSGSTFGRDGGHAQVLDAFATMEEAEALMAAAAATPEKDDFISRYSFTHNGKDYSRSWVGHFESLNRLDIWDVIVRQNPADPFRKKGTGRYSLRRGN